MKGRRLYLATISLLAGMVATACSSSSDKDVLNSKPDFIGFITAIDSDETGKVPLRFTVESHADKLVHRRFVRLNERTALFRREEKTRHPAERSALHLQTWVEIWFADAGKVSEEVIARQIVITDRP